MVTYPMDNYYRDYNAEDAELYNCPRSSGIWTEEDFPYTVTGTDSKIYIGPGLGWIRNGKFRGKVVAEKYGDSYNLSVPDQHFPRIDAVVIQFDANAVNTEIVIKSGVAKSDPEPPAIVRTEAVYELHLYHIYRKPGNPIVKAADITDKRLDPEFCGLMADAVTQIDTSAINQQVQDFIAQLRAEIAAVKNDSAYMMRDGSTAMTGPLDLGGNIITSTRIPEIIPVNDTLENAVRDFVVHKMPSVSGDQAAVAEAVIQGEELTFAGKPQRFCAKIYKYAKPGDVFPVAVVDAVSADLATHVRMSIIGNIPMDWRYVNPPFEANVEYLTTDRYDGMIVCCKAVPLGKIPYNTTASIPHKIFGVENVLRCVAFMSSGEPVPYFRGDESVEVCADKTEIRIRTKGFKSQPTQTAVARIWYTSRSERED